MSDINNITYGAGLKNGKIKTSDGTEYDIAAIVEASSDKEQDEVEVKGDDDLKAKFVFSVVESLTLTANAITFDVIQAITGHALVSSADGIEIPLGTVEEQNAPYVEVWAESTAKDDSGNNVTIRKVWHKVQIQAVKTEQSGESEFNVEITATAYQTILDVEGNDLPDKRVATLYVVK